MELALLLFLVILATELVNLLGKTVLIDLVCPLAHHLAFAAAADDNSFDVRSPGLLRLPAAPSVFGTAGEPHTQAGDSRGQA